MSILFFSIPDIFATGTGVIIATVDCEKGDSASASDTEINGYSGDAELYLGDDEKDNDTQSGVENNFVPEGKLIALNDDTEEEEEEEPSTEVKVDQVISKSLTNDSISEIANKLTEVNVSQITTNESNDIKPGKPVKVDTLNSNFMDSLGFKESESEISSEDRCGYVSSGETSYQEKKIVQQRDDGFSYNDTNNSKTNEKRKKLRKRTMSHTEENVKTVKELESSGDFLVETDPHPPKKTNGHTHNERHRRKSNSRKKSEESNEKQPSSNNKKSASLEEQSNKKISVNKLNDPPVGSDNKVKKSRGLESKSKKRRKRTRHKIYLDDPDVHQLINDHVTLIQRFIADVESGKHLNRNQHHHDSKSLFVNSYKFFFKAFKGYSTLL